MKGSVKLGSILGVPLWLHYSWFVVLFLITSSLAILLSDVRPFWSLMERWIVALASSTVLFASVVAHELSHGLVAQRNGIPVKGITLFIFGGVAHISREAASPRIELLIALAGPLCSILLGLLFYGLSFVVEPLSIHLAVMMSWLFVMNIVLGVFNLIPGFPLDGGRVFRAVVWAISGNYARATRIATYGGQVTALVFAAIGVGIFLLDHNPVQGIWLGFIGWFLWQAALTSFRQFRQRQGLQGMVARDLMSTDYAEISPEMSANDLIDGGVLRRSQTCFVVAEDGRISGFLNLAAVKKVAKRSRETTRVRQVMVPLDMVAWIAPEDDSNRVMEALDDEELGVVPVMDGEAVVGVVMRQHLLRLMISRSEQGRRREV
ncbi:MAG: site-2 protease family protein [Chloroflexi bacterium]|nr:site-2 protease family protein [Chloroflexota bacterium]